VVSVVSCAKTTATLPRTNDRASIIVISLFITYLLWDGANLFTCGYHSGPHMNSRLTRN
jgi:hypothetical protein